MISRAHFLPMLVLALLLSSCSWVDKGVGGNIPPRSADDSFTVNEGGMLELLTYEEGVLGNDEDGGNRQLTARLLEGKGPTFAAEDGFTFNSDGTFTYVHNGEEPPAAVKVNDEIVRHCDFFTYVASDGIADGEPKDVCIDIQAVNDVPKIIDQRTISTNEDTPVTITPANLLIEDPDNTQEELSVIIESGDHYQLEQNTIHPASNFNGDLSVDLSVSDGKAVSEPFTVTVKVISVNDPTIITQKAPVPFVMDEDTTRQITFDDLEVTDPDNIYPDDFTLKVKNGNFYSVEADNTIRPALNRNSDNLLGEESLEDGLLGVLVDLTDKDGQTSGVTLKVRVKPVNDPPVAKNSTIEVDEGASFEAQAPGLLNADKASDVDGDSLSVDTTPVTPPQHGSLTLKTDGSWEYEHDGSETLNDSFTYKIVDGHGGSDTATVTITVKPVNDIAPVVTVGQSFSAAENSPNGTVIGVVVATDADSADSPITGFAITGGNTNNAFVIDNGGQIAVATTAALDYETTPVFNLLITATDGINTSAAETVVVNLSNVNDVAPVVTAGQSFSAAENSPNGTVIGTVAATDLDSPVTGFMITGGNTGNAFAIDSSGQITVATSAALDYETTPSFNLQVAATDGTNTSAAAAVAINLNNINDIAPIVTAGQIFSVAENSPIGMVVGIVVATDADSPITGFTISGGNTNNAFTINNSGQLAVAANTALDYEATPTFNLQITATDGTNTSVVETVVVNLSNINDVAPVVTAGQTFSVAENSINGTVVGTVAATDVDSSVTGFTITGGNTGTAFAIDSSGQLTVATSTALDYETTPTFNLQVTATDGTNTSVVETVMVDLIDNPNEVAPVVTAGQIFSVAENSANSAVVGTVLATDADGNGTITGFSITAGNTNSAFAIDGSGQLTVATSAALDYETTPTFNLQVTATDGTNTSVAETVVVDLIDNPNEAAPVVTAGQSFSIAENTPNSIVVGTVLATDADGNGTITGFSITAGNTNNAFAIDNSGKLSVGNSGALDYETTPIFNLQVTATDGTNTSVAEIVEVKLTDVIGASTNLPPQVSGICRSTPLNVPVENILLSASDPDGDDSQLRFYQVTSGTKGSVTMGINGWFSYTPYFDARGVDTFTFKVVDQQGAETFATAKIIIGNTRILPMGDAITVGSTDGSDAAFGYRQALRSSLTDLGYAVEFVGSQASAPDRHEGHPGSQVTSAYVAANVEGWLDASPPDVVLLHIGSQEFVAGGGDPLVSEAGVASILRSIDAWSTTHGQDVTVLLAKIIDQNPANVRITTFNNLIATLAQTDKVIIVDQQGVLDYPADLADEMLPNTVGYQKMTAAWRRKLENGVLDKCP